jgi:hypothetical protein
MPLNKIFKIHISLIHKTQGFEDCVSQPFIAPSAEGASEGSSGAAVMQVTLVSQSSALVVNAGSEHLWHIIKLLP